MVTFPNAKINIGLDILRKRPDGYHDISTVMMPVPWNDILEIVPKEQNDSDTLHVSGREINCPPEKNLVMKAVAAMRKRASFPAVNIYLHKVIPDGAGMGGGSADASFTLAMLNEMFSLGMSKQNLADIAATIGADCPFFIYNRPMLCEGTGTEMNAFELNLPAGLILAIVKPDVAVPTRDAYAAVKPQTPENSITDLLTALPIEEWQGKVKNDFEKSVFASYPEIAKVKAALLDEGAVYAAMSGSGSAVFAMFTHKDYDTLSYRIKSLFTKHDIMVKPIS